MTLETGFDVPFVARLALREKQVQQSYRPIISIHKWFARRPGTLFRSLLLSEFGQQPLAEAYWKGQDLAGTVADPFMGGGTTVFEALRLGMSVVASDVNPMSYWLVRQAVEEVDLDEFSREGERVWRELNDRLGDLYRTVCTSCGATDADVKYILWAKTCGCPSCGSETPLFPGYRVAEAARHPREVYACPACKSLEEFEPGTRPECSSCGLDLTEGNVRRGQATCLSCGHGFRFSPHLSSPPAHRPFAIEYNCHRCYAGQPGRQFKAPDEIDLSRIDDAAHQLREVGTALPIPEDEIPRGDETDRLHRWGYRRYREMFNDRQLLALGTLLQIIKGVPDVRIRHALATVFSDFLRYQNLLCRYDTYALKCQDIFAVHGFPVGLIACENNVPGVPGIGSGSFIHFVSKFAKAKHYAKAPFEISRVGATKKVISTVGERIEAPLVQHEPLSERAAWIACEPSQTLDLRPNSLDGVFTDPPYFDMVQYAELMDFCFVWLRKFLSEEVPEFARATTRSDHELTGNDTLSRGLVSFADGMSQVFRTMADAMKPGAPFVFTYHHNEPSAYAPLVIALLDARLNCTAVLPAPGEMAASLHIAGTKSSILDSVFVCRASNAVSDTGTVAERVERDRLRMEEAGYRCTVGDLLCLSAGHVAADAVRLLRDGWDPATPVDGKLNLVTATMIELSSSEVAA
jgi:adenine-specific DNA methylase